MNELCYSGHFSSTFLVQFELDYYLYVFYFLCNVIHASLLLLCWGVKGLSVNAGTLSVTYVFRVLWLD